MTSPSIIEKLEFKQSDKLNSLIIFLLKLEVFLIPVFFLPFTFEIFEFSKQNLLWLLTALAAAIWLLNSIIIKKEINYKRTPLDIPILVMLVLWGMSAIFSVDVFSSWFGYYGRFSDAFLTTIALVLTYFLTVNTVAQKHLVSFLQIILFSGGVVLLVSLLSVSGYLSRWPFLGQFNLLNSQSFHLLGAASETLSIFAAVFLVFVIALYSYNAKANKKKPALIIKYYFLIFLSLALLLLTNVTVAWITSLFGLTALFGFALYIAYLNKDRRASAIELSIAPVLIFFVISLLFVFSGSDKFNLNEILFTASLPREALAPVAEVRTIVWQSFKTNPLFGSGPGTFAYDFSLFRPALLNSHQLWQLRFDKAPSYLLELIATVGLLGALSYLIVIGIFLLVSFIFLKNMFRKATEESYLAFAFSFIVLVLFIAQIFYIVIIPLLFLFWVCAALAMLAWRFTFTDIFVEKKINLTKFRQFISIFKLGAGAAILLLVIFMFTQLKYYWADVNYNSYRLSGERAQLLRAIELNPNVLNYHIALAKDYIAEVRDEINILSSPASLNQQVIEPAQKDLLQTNISQALAEAEWSTKIAPNSVMAWEVIAVIYRDIKSIAVGSVDPAIRYFEKASELEPTNPVLLTELGKMYSLRNKTHEAIEVLNKAIESKPNYFEAYIALAKAYENLGQTDKALVMLETIITQSPPAEIIYEAGRLYYNQKNYSQAIDKFIQALQLNPNYANSLYSLGLVYKKQGENSKALEQFNKLLELDPKNQAIKDIISELN